MQKSKKFIIEDKQGNNMYPATFADVVFTEDGDNVAEKLKQIEGATPNAHTHTKSQITDFAHTHTKSEISDFNHTHTKEEITNFPTSLPANGGNADTVGGISPGEFARKTGAYEELVSGATRVLDTRDTNQPPSWYFKNKGRRIVNEFKNCAKLGLSDSAMYCTLQTIVMWDDSSGGKISQIAYRSGRTPMIRCSENEETWGAWQSFGGNTGAVKSVQRGIAMIQKNDNTKMITISPINVNKSFVLLHGDYDSVKPMTTQPYVKELSGDCLTIANSYGTISNTAVYISWQVIEFN